MREEVAQLAKNQKNIGRSLSSFKNIALQIYFIHGSIVLSKEILSRRALCFEPNIFHRNFHFCKKLFRLSTRCRLREDDTLDILYIFALCCVPAP